MPKIPAQKPRSHRSILELEDQQDDLLKRLDELNRRIEATLAAVERETRAASTGPLSAQAA